MRVSDEQSVDVLRKKARVLESENERLSKEIAAVLRENLSLKGMSAEAIELNLPGLVEQVTAASSRSSSTRPGSEGRPHTGSKEPKQQKGHGPTEQPELSIVEETFDVDAADKACTQCGGALEEWLGGEDEVEVVDVVERKWVLKKCKLKKYRCRCGGCVETALGPDKLIKGGRYTLDVAIAAAVGKYVDHLPLDRQTRMAKRQGLALTSQALWDQCWALTCLVEPLCVDIKHHILTRTVIGADESGFMHIQKGGAVKWQAWQLSCPVAIYFEVLPSKKAAVGEKLFVVERDGGEVLRFSGTAVMDGAAELETIANSVGFDIAACWSHARRNVLKAEKEAPGQVAQFLDLVGELYAVDRRAAGPPPEDDPRSGYRHLIDPDKLRELRHVESRVICDRIREWIEAQHCIPGGLLKKGLGYVAARWSRLLRFLDDPLIPLDNNLTEGSYIGLAIGRRNYIGARSERGTIAAARFYTIVESARVNGVDGEAYLRYAAGTLLAGERPQLPHEWAPGR